MNLSIVATGLAELDEIHLDTLVLHHFLEDRPLKGLAGFTDWRLNGRLAEHVLKSWASGRMGDRVLMPGGPRLGVERILLVGLGSRTEFSPDHFRMISLQMLHTLLKLQVKGFALSLPGLDALKIAPRQAAEIWLTAFHQTYVTPGLAHPDLNVCFVTPRDQVEGLTEPIKIFERRYREA